MNLIKHSFGLLCLLLSVQLAFADDRVRVPQEEEPPVYTSAAGPAFQPDGSIFVVNDGEWAAIPFWRATECVPANFNLLDQVDAPGAFGCELLVEGFVRRQRVTETIMSWEAKAVDEVPVWFVRMEELEDSMSDNILTIAELEAMDSLLIGSADIYQEQNHTFFGHQVSHLSLRASGTLEDGRRFRLGATEVGLELIQVNISFR